MGDSSDSHISLDKGGGVSFIGADATLLFRARQIKMALKLWKQGLKVTRQATLTKLLTAASDFTKKTYRGKKDIDTAMDDLNTWIVTMEAALPIQDNREKTNG